MRTLSTSCLSAFAIVCTGCTTVPRNSVDYPRNPIDFSVRSKAVLLVASSPKSMCGIAHVSTLRLYKIAGPGTKAEDKWIDGLGLNADIFKSDIATQRTFLQAFQIDPGEYRFELYFPASILGSYYRPNVRPTIQVAAGEVRYLGNFESEGCGDIKLRVANDWEQFSPTFQRLFPGVPSQSVGLSPLRLSLEQ